MNINFEKSDRLISIIENAVNLLNNARYYLYSASELKRSDIEEYKTLYVDLVKINYDTNATMAEKRNKIGTALSKALRCDIGVGINRFDMERSNIEEYARNLCEAYWALEANSSFGVNDMSKDNFDDWMNFLQSGHYTERYLDILAKAIVSHEPTVKDIEKEFWANCPDTPSIDKFVNIYREYWKGHLHEIDDNSDRPEQKRYEEYTSDLLMCGFITEREALYIDAKLDFLAKAVKRAIEEVTALFNRLSSPSAAGTKEDEAEADNRRQRTMRVTTETLMRILRKAGLQTGKVQNKDIAELISCLTGFNSERIRQELSNNEKLPYRSREEIEKINTAFKNLNLEISITYDEENRRLKN